MYSREYWEIFKSTYLKENLRTTASYFMKKNRHTAEDQTTQVKKLNQWKSMNLQFCKITCLQRKIQRKCMQFNQIPGAKLSRLARTKFNFYM